MLKGKSAVVTGATSGIGLVIAKALAAQGCNLVFNGLGDPQEIENLRRGIAEDFAVKSIYHGADLRKPEDIPALIEAAEEAFGRLDILINNAGIQHVSPIETFPSERWDAIIATNLSAAFYTIRAALPGMKRQGWGRIINIGDAAPEILDLLDLFLFTSWGFKGAEPLWSQQSRVPEHRVVREGS